MNNYKIIISELENDIDNLHYEIQIMKKPFKREISRLQDNVKQLLIDNHLLLEMNVSQRKIMVEGLYNRYSVSEDLNN